MLISLIVDVKEKRVHRSRGVRGNHGRTGGPFPLWGVAVCLRGLGTPPPTTRDTGTAGKITPGRDY